MTNLKRIEGKTIKSISENNDGTNSYLIIKFEEGGKLNIVSFLRGDKGVAQLDVDLGGLTPEKLVGKRILSVEEEFDGEQDHINFILRGGQKIKVTSFCSSPTSTASLEATLYSGDNIVAESLEELFENSYQKWGQYQMSKPQYESGERGGVRITIYDYKRLIQWVMMKLEKEYDGVKKGTGGQGNYAYIEVNDPIASIEDVSDLLYKYIEKGIIHSVDEL